MAFIVTAFMGLLAFVLTFILLGDPPTQPGISFGAGYGEIIVAMTMFGSMMGWRTALRSAGMTLESVKTSSLSRMVGITVFILILTPVATYAFGFPTTPIAFSAIVIGAWSRYAHVQVMQARHASKPS